VEITQDFGVIFYISAQLLCSAGRVCWLVGYAGNFVFDRDRLCCVEPPTQVLELDVPQLAVRIPLYQFSSFLSLYFLSILLSFCVLFELRSTKQSCYKKLVFLNSFH